MQPIAEPAGLAPLAIGMCLTLIHLISIPVTNTSVNPARSTGVAVYVGDWAIEQLWLFWVPQLSVRYWALRYIKLLDVKLQRINWVLITKKRHLLGAAFLYEHYPYTMFGLYIVLTLPSILLRLK